MRGKNPLRYACKHSHKEKNSILQGDERVLQVSKSGFFRKEEIDSMGEGGQKCIFIYQLTFILAIKVEAKEMLNGSISIEL